MSADKLLDETIAALDGAVGEGEVPVGLTELAAKLQPWLLRILRRERNLERVKTLEEHKHFCRWCRKGPECSRARQILAGME